MERNVSSPNLYHLTKKFEYLRAIVQNKYFKVYYVLETFFFIENSMRFAIPMVCFTDLPKGVRGKHRARYGDYGIVLKKEWARNNGICPVLYCKKDGKLTETIRVIYHTAPKLQMRLLSYCKPYYAHYYNREQGKWSDNNVRFYDEREWRYVPDFNIEDIKNVRAGEEFEGIISFTDNDVVRIYVTSEAEKNQIAKYIDIEKIIII
ncbi:abortive infection system antitoxin AbiGi family protein [Alistipes shahii]|jgi:hypothetical protein|uniref:abortive infection system antitoxin AbiGi family protein n=1 Tax=Alistipes shahii TaxID=328814 RepID=UPI001459754C|nr:abortive infection system antitoxin AbiGi family protein [Alistipes shahii]NMF24143.1 hypothetical protein [Alistipes shahii]